MKYIKVIWIIFIVLFATASAQAFNRQELADMQAKALNGDVMAQVNMGDYYDGRDCPEALKWYKMAAAQGQFDARMRIANYYAFGRCNGAVKRDIIKGYVLYRKIQQQYVLHPESQAALNKHILDFERELTAEQLEEAEKQINMPWNF